jgi:hypothetical protein
MLIVKLVLTLKTLITSASSKDAKFLPSSFKKTALRGSGVCHLHRDLAGPHVLRGKLGADAADFVAAVGAVAVAAGDEDHAVAHAADVRARHPGGLVVVEMTKMKIDLFSLLFKKLLPLYPGGSVAR